MPEIEERFKLKEVSERFELVNHFAGTKKWKASNIRGLDYNQEMATPNPMYVYLWLKNVLISFLCDYVVLFFACFNSSRRFQSTTSCGVNVLGEPLNQTRSGTFRHGRICSSYFIYVGR